MKNIFCRFSFLFVLIFMFFSCNPISIYNKIVEKDEAVNAAWAQVENQYQRRYDLIPNLVSTVKAAATHESETLQKVIACRNQATQFVVTKEVIEDDVLFAKYQETQSALSSSLRQLLAVAESYPELKANENFLALQSQLEGTENRIAVERKRYNEQVQDFNSFIRKIPNCWFKGDARAKQMFKATQEAQVAPTVKF